MRLDSEAFGCRHLKVETAWVYPATSRSGATGSGNLYLKPAWDTCASTAAIPSGSASVGVIADQGAGVTAPTNSVGAVGIQSASSSARACAGSTNCSSVGSSTDWETGASASVDDSKTATKDLSFGSKFHLEARCFHECSQHVVELSALLRRA